MQEKEEDTGESVERGFWYILVLLCYLFTCKTHTATELHFFFFQQAIYRLCLQIFFSLLKAN